MLLVEVEPRLRPDVVGLLLPNSPLRVLDSLGLVDQCVARDFVHTDIELCDSSGRVRAHLRPPSLVEGRPAQVSISRHALAEVLLEAVDEAGFELRLATTVRSVDDTGDRFRTRLGDGSREDVDVVAVADGGHSRTRSILAPDAPSAAGSRALGPVGAGLDALTRGSPDAEACAP